ITLELRSAIEPWHVLGEEPGEGGTVRFVDSSVERLQVRLTDMEGAEWTTEAVGVTKRQLSAALLKRLKARFAPGGMLHYGQGKWYPGESLPRWALACYWRADGVPIWHDEALVADESVDGGRTTADAQAFLSALGQHLRIDTQYIVPAYEDVWTLLSQERHLPLNVTPETSELDDPEARERLARAFERGVWEIVGYVLPLDRRRFSPPRWVTGPWPFRSGYLFLQPGDSPIGLRLPLDALPWIEPTAYPHLVPPDPFAPRTPLPGASRLHQPYRRGAESTARIMPIVMEQQIEESDVSRPAANGSAAAVIDAAHDQNGAAGSTTERLPGQVANDVRTALCVEPRQGRLYVFLPPTRELEDYLDLVAAIEAAAKALDMPVILEGYPPPADYRLQQIKVTPDPGVIEVNIHPSRSWRELVAAVTGVYDDARQIRLGAEKFMLDGKHTGTGGGNHFTLGGPTPADSPLLRRPDLLRSLVAYWNNHPSLSYLFSGLFIGPTSQAPRLDEGRHDSLYELEIAFRQIPDDGPCPPWLVDRVFRHLLVDMTGNTHRAEFCIDKLYAPESSSGRLGLLELRAFEMPPHARMSLVQQLLVRALIARFWQTPYTQPLVPWGTSLHDRFMLPHYVEADFRQVLEELREAGYTFDPEWFAPHIEFRFPRYGHVTYDGITLELRSAIEPWHVLGEEPGEGGTVRFVDSSVERLQVRLTGMVDNRHVVVCNGRRLPLQPTSTAHEFVAGVRYRAWQPPSCLHPTIPVQTPLSFDMIDTWSERAIGGCTYHVAHPGGRNFETFPVNAFEAESRRAARFEPFGHSPGPVQVPPEERNPHFPCTLDLRR
ncbi:IMP dehydrogenase, partial [Candidatus Entotheonella serta]